MKTFSRYLTYRLKTGMLRVLIMAILAVLILFLVLPECLDGSDVKWHSSGLYMQATLLSIVASIVPILELSGLKNRRNLDTLYFFPIKRAKLALVHFAGGFLQVFAIYTVTYFVHFAYLALKTDYFALVYMIPYYFLSLALGFVIYSVYMFIFTQANTVVDGVLFCILWIFLAALVMLTGMILLGPDLSDPLDWLPEWGILYVPINHLTVLYEDLIEINREVNMWSYTVEQIMEHLEMFVVWGVVGVAAAYGYVYSFVKKGAQQAGEISNSLFGYKTLLPIYGCCFLLLSGSTLFTCLLYLILMLVGYIIYRRGFKFKLSDILVTLGGGFIALLLRAVINEIWYF